VRRTSYFRALATNFERQIDAARAAYERNDPHGALKKLDRARRDALKRRNQEQLQRVLDFAEGVIARDASTEIERENLIYAIRQNLRQVTRRRAYEDETEWVDPFPDLESPRSHTRTFMSRGLKFWIGVGVALGVLIAAAFVAAVIAGALSSGGDELALRIRNDTGQRVSVEWCETASCDGDLDPLSTTHLDPGEYRRRDLPADDIVDLFVIEDADGDRAGCLPVRVDRTWQELLLKNEVVVVRVSEATPCPGKIVTPRAAF
jgi:hypothetical protein